MFSVARLAAVAAVALLAFGFALAGVSAPEPVTTAPPTDAATSSRPCLVTPFRGLLLAGDCTYETDALGIGLTINGTGHFVYSELPNRISLQGVDSTSRPGSIEIIAVRSLPATPCDGDGIGLPGSAPMSIAAYLAWLRESPLGLYPNIDTTVGGVDGQRIRVGPIPMPTPNEDDPECLFMWLAGGDIMGGAFLGVGTGEVADINVLAVGSAVYLVVAHYAGSEPGDLTGVLAQLDGIRFEP